MTSIKLKIVLHILFWGITIVLFHSVESDAQNMVIIDFKLPPDMLGNPNPGYVEFHNEIGVGYVTEMNGGENSILRFSFNGASRLGRLPFGVTYDMGLGVWNNGRENQMFPVAVVGLKCLYETDNIAISPSIGVGVPEFLHPAFDIGIKRDGEEFLTVRLGLLSSVTLHISPLNVTLITVFSDESPSMGGSSKRHGEMTASFSANRIRTLCLSPI